jgi:formiminotetrahydrofolate cyclodeaminase
MKEVAPKLMAARPDEDADSWNDSLEKAMSVPAKVMKDILKVLRQARRLINDADIALLCDVRAGVVLLYGALESCALLAELNITLLEYASEKKDDMAWLLEERRNEAIDLYNNIMDMM